ncbi:hypothetical protein V6N13_059679 [Hibiscus sabdariffa]
MVDKGLILGHIVSSDGIAVDRSKTDVIRSLPYPTKVREIRSLLGHAGFYRRFIKDFSKIAQPLCNLQKDQLFDFNSACKDAWDTLKEKLISTPIVQPSNWEHPFELMCDASDTSVGTVLGQKAGKEPHVIAYASRTLDSAQKNYSTREKNFFHILCFREISLLFIRFGTPRAIISDRGTHFLNRIIDALMNKHGVTHRVTMTYHPQSNGQAEVSNREIKTILEKIVKPDRKDWSLKLSDTIWAYRTAYKGPIGMSPYRLVYGKPCHLPVELEHRAYWVVKLCNMEMEAVGKARKLHLQELEEIQRNAYDSAQIYIEKTKEFHDRRISFKTFNIGQKVLLFNSKLKLFAGKLQSKCLGPYTMTKVFPHGAVEVEKDSGERFKVNGQRLKPYYENAPIRFIEEINLENPIH